MFKNKQVIFNQMIEIANHFDKEKEHYLLPYSYFLDYFKRIEEICLED